MRRIQASPFSVGDKVRLRPDVLAHHARSVPARAGFTHEQFEWRKTLDELEGRTGEIQRTFENSKHVNVQFPGILIGIDCTELEGVSTEGGIMSNPQAEWWVEYYDRVGEHGGHAMHSRENAVRDAVRLASRAKRRPSEELYIGIYDYSNNVGEVFWATPDYIEIVESRDPEGNPPGFIRALKEFVRTGRRAPYDLNEERAETARRNPGMERAEVRKLVMSMFDLGYGEWDEAVTNIKKTDRYAIQEMESAASGMAVEAAMLSEYLEYRGAAGMGDHGHEDAMKQAQKARKRIRKALGYSYP